ncbi:ABC transporter ATP-binding protein [Jiella sp. MQZ9-1]|uniref:ABC transporter ATP-binding protein n=1 Tax=Jiella flava TaxID=2816857 RepID=A0A939FZ53_9HYPH|nr:ABC transporter ATP-binding protein [Jiella flava]MBO0662890.1 ABC transporter ATP-binding protein [Jiella flava]MCD2471350.1 ABC transporter ATP-binding protein [Jiella flava]
MMEIDGLAKAFDGVPALVDVALSVRNDEYLTLLGPSGSGKSTLLRLIAGLEQADAGKIRLDGADLTHAPAHLRGLGFVQQKYALFPTMSVADNIAFGLRHRRLAPVSDAAEVARRVARMIDLVGLAGLEGRQIGQLSGGQKQRVSLARTLVTEPKICLLDEPLGALDANLRERMTVELRRIREALGVTFLHVTGNEAEALAMGDRMVVLDAGRVLQVDSPATVYSAPATVRVARFVNAYNLLSGKSSGGRFRRGAHDLPLPPGVGDAAHYALRYDAVAIDEPAAALDDDRASLPATFIASEFLGSRVVYLFRLPDGAVMEVERHLSRFDPIVLRPDEPRRLSWAICDVLAFDAAGTLISNDRLGRAA